MIVTVTWDLVETRQADIEVPDDTPSAEITRLAYERAGQGGGEIVSVALVDGVHWVTEGAQPQRFGGHYGGGH